MKKFWLDFSVGLFVIIGLIAIIFLAFRVGNLSSITHNKDYYTLIASFDNIGSVRPGSPIKSAGFVVGQVDSIFLNSQNYRSVAKLSIKKQYQFPLDSSVSVLTAGLLGEQYLSLQPGIESDMMQEGDNLEYTESAVVLEKLIGQLMIAFTRQEEK